MLSCYKNLGPLSYKDIYEALLRHNVSINSSDNFQSLEFDSFKGIENCKTNDLSFLYDDYKYDLPKILPRAIIISNKNKNFFDLNKIITISVDNINQAVAIISNLFYRDFTNDEKEKLFKTSLYNQRNISDNAIIKNNCKIGENFNIEDGSIINDGCIIGNNVCVGSNTIIQNAVIGDNVSIESNCSIGQQGFGFAFNKSKNINIYHIGRVILQDNVYIGSNCTIDRGSFSDTIIGKNVYLDNQVHIAHNVSIGINSVIAGQSGVAGSAKIGNFVKIGGQVGIAGHINIGNYVEIAAKSGVRSNVKDNQKIMGDPAINMFTYLKKYKKTFN